MSSNDIHTTDDVPAFSTADALAFIAQAIDDSKLTSVATYTPAIGEAPGSFGPMIEVLGTVDESTFTELVVDVRLDDGTDADTGDLPVLGRFRITVEAVTA